MLEATVVWWHGTARCSGFRGERTKGRSRLGSRRAAQGAIAEGPGPEPGPGVGGGESGHHRDDTLPRDIPDPRSPGRRKARKAADVERRERHRQAEERLAAERAQRRA